METSNATVAVPAGESPFIGHGDRTQLFTLPNVCAFDLSPCPLISGAMPPEDGFCRECGVMLGAPIGEGMGNTVQPKLVDDTGREFPLKFGLNVVGREGADVMLPDKTVSRKHALIGVEEVDTVWLEDTNSTNGTRCDGATLTPRERTYLANGMTLQFGSVEVKVAMVESSGPKPAALPAPDAGDGLLAIAAPAPPAAAVLVGYDGTTHVLTAAKTTFGRRQGNDIILTGDSFVSGNHSQITYENLRFILTDLGSTNGTKVNGQRLSAQTPYVLRQGDEVTMGQTTFIFHSPDDK